MKEAKWIMYKPAMYGNDVKNNLVYTDTFECTICKSHVVFPFYSQHCDYDYCPYCGIKMKGETKMSEIKVDLISKKAVIDCIEQVRNLQAYDEIEEIKKLPTYSADITELVNERR